MIDHKHLKDTQPTHVNHKLCVLKIHENHQLSWGQIQSKKLLSLRPWGPGPTCPGHIGSVNFFTLLACLLATAGLSVWPVFWPTLVTEFWGKRKIMKMNIVWIIQQLWDSTWKPMGPHEVTNYNIRAPRVEKRSSATGCRIEQAHTLRRLS